jgi:hypothetical protein
MNVEQVANLLYIICVSVKKGKEINNFFPAFDLSGRQAGRRDKSEPDSTTLAPCPE